MQQSLLALEPGGKWVRIDRRGMLTYGRDAAHTPLKRKPIYPVPKVGRAVARLFLINVMQDALRTPEIGQPFWPRRFPWNQRKRPVWRAKRK